MYSKTLIFLFIGVCSISNFECCCSLIYDSPKLVRYGEPCFSTRQLPIMIEGPKPSVQSQKIPISLDFRVASNVLAKPRRLEYPIAIDVPLPTLPPDGTGKIIVEEDTLRGKSYAYNTYVPPANDAISLSKNYNFAVDVPVSVERIVPEKSTERFVQRLTGLTTRIDRVLVPACEISSPSSSCRC